MGLFERYILEAPDDPSGTQSPPAASAPPTAPPTNDPPPDMPDDPPPDDTGADIGDQPMEGDDDAPPDLDGMGDPEDFGDPGEEPPEEDQGSELELDEKISTIMNQNLYQRYLVLLNEIGTQLSGIKNNSDALYTLYPEYSENIAELKKLEENVRLYIKNSFIKENYSKNLLFFNKCINLLKMLNDDFNKNIRKGMKNVE